KKIKELSRKIDELLKENKILKEKKDKPLKAVEELKKKHIELQKRINQKSDSIETGKNIGDKGQSTNRGDSLPIDQSKNVIWKAVLEKLSPEDQQMLKKALNEENFSESTTSKKGVSHDKFDEKLMIQPINERHRKADQVSRINLNEQKKQIQGRISSIKR